MPTLAFWNIDGSEIAERVAELVREYSVEILVLAECQIPDERLLTALNSNGLPFFVSTGLPNRVKILSHYDENSVDITSDDDYYSARHFKPPTGASFLVVGAHLQSQDYHDRGDRVFNTSILAEEIRGAEKKIGHRRTVVLGDLNANPFEDGVVAAKGLHAIMDRSVVRAGTRTVSRKDYDFFYNPMWSKFGDLGGRPSGTYFYRKSTQISFFWHMFDQVLLRPGLLLLRA